MTRKFENQTERKGRPFVKTLETPFPLLQRNEISFFRIIHIYIYIHELKSNAMRIEERERERGGDIIKRSTLFLKERKKERERGGSALLDDKLKIVSRCSPP